MDSQNPSDQTAAGPQPEVLKPRAAAGAVAAPATNTRAKPPAKRLGRRTYRPSHKATLIGLGAVIAILAVNAAVIGLVLKKQSNSDSLAAKGQVSISSADLNQLGINRSTISNSNVQLTVAPDAQFKGKLVVDGSSTLSGQVTINSKLVGTDANIAQLAAGKFSANDLNINGDGTLNTLNLRRDLAVAGVTKLQGAVTVNNSLSVVGNLTIGGTFSATNFSARSLTSVSTFTVGGHIITGGPTPGVGRGGSALGSNGTVSISGNDASGTIYLGIGVGATAGTLANVSFTTQYGSIPQVVVTPVGVGASFYLSSVSKTGFSVAVASGLPPGGYQINYIVMQ